MVPAKIEQILSGADITPDGRQAKIRLSTPHGAITQIDLDHLMLGRLINDLQLLALEAQRRRATGLPADPSGEPIPRGSNLIRQIDVSLDALGRGALWRAVHQDGTLTELQLSLRLLQSLLERLPNYVAELKARQHASGSPN